MKVDRVGDKKYYVAEKPNDFDGWTILHVERWKKDVCRIHMKQDEAIGPMSHSRMVYCKDEFLPAHWARPPQPGTKEYDLQARVLELEDKIRRLDAVLYDAEYKLSQKARDLEENESKLAYWMERQKKLIEKIRSWYRSKTIPMSCPCGWSGTYAELWVPSDEEREELGFEEFGDLYRWCPACGDGMDDPISEYRALGELLEEI